jgi:cell division protein FtsW (lipid II flippase)
VSLAQLSRITLAVWSKKLDRFSFVMVLLSIIVGLGITELLSNFARQIQTRATSKFYWLHTLLAVIVFIALLQQWWESWDQRLVESWSFPIMLLMLGGPIGLYLVSHILFPKDIDGEDFEKHYFASAPVMYLIGMATVFCASVYRPLSFGHELLDPDNATSVFIFLTFLALATAKSRRLHSILVPLLFGAILLDVLVFHMSI